VGARSPRRSDAARLETADALAVRRQKPTSCRPLRIAEIVAALNSDGSPSSPSPDVRFTGRSTADRDADGAVWLRANARRNPAGQSLTADGFKNSS